MRCAVKDRDRFRRDDAACVVQNLDLERVVTNARLKFLKRDRCLVAAAFGRGKALLDRVAVDGFVAGVKADRPDIELDTAVAGGVVVRPSCRPGREIAVGQQLGAGHRQTIADDIVVARATRQGIRPVYTCVGSFVQPRRNDRNAIVGVTGGNKDATFDINGFRIQKLCATFRRIR